MTGTRPIRAALAGALVASVVGLASTLLLPSAAAAACAGFAALACAIASALTWRRHSAAGDGLVEKAAKEAETGRKLVIYERTTGLFAYWYMAMRTEEECARATRYEMPFALAVVEPATGSNEWALHGLLSDWLQANTRATDLAGYAGNGRFLVLMVQTNEAAAVAVLERLRSQIANVEAGISVFPTDGASFAELYATAQSRLAGLTEAA
ncbi:MAG: hypothetical protein QME71_00390 [Dehalococcoidia bacterium]|nr:hypothetical protein [Dehalococcoidia bacterium]